MSESIILIGTLKEKREILQQVIKSVEECEFEKETTELISLSLAKRVYDKGTENAISAKLGLPIPNRKAVVDYEIAETKYGIFTNIMNTLRSVPADKTVNSIDHFYRLDELEHKVGSFLDSFFELYEHLLDIASAKMEDLLTKNDIDNLSGFFCDVTPTSFIITAMEDITVEVESVSDLLKRIEYLRRELVRLDLCTVYNVNRERYLKPLVNLDHAVVVLETAERSGEEVCSETLSSLYGEFYRMEQRIKDIRK